jgi:hypothetical protein
VRRTVLALSATAVLGGLALPSHAAVQPPPVPVGISHDHGKVCVWVSLQVPQCVSTGTVQLP